MDLISGEKYLVDTNVLVYSVNQKSPFYSVSRELLERGIEEGIDFVVAQQNLVEFVAVLTRAYGIKNEEATRDAEAFASQFEVITPTVTTFELFAQLSRRIKTPIYPFDLYLITTMIENEVSRIISANIKDFQDPELKLEEILDITKD